MDYPFQSIKVNGRELTIGTIVNEDIQAEDDFEKSTFEFIRSWVRGEEVFTVNTSGSTGLPKPIVIHRWQMLASAHATAEALDLKKGDNAFVCLDTRFIAGKMMLVRALSTGMRIHAVTPSANPLEKIDWGMTVDFVAFVPYQLQAILASPHASKLNAVRNMLVGGAPVPPHVEKLIMSYHTRAYVTYGMTETISHVALRSIKPETASPFYDALPGVSFEVDERSCLNIHCPYISEKVITNDVVRLISQTTFEWIGRYDNVINSGGVKVHPESIERQIEPLIRRLNLHGRLVVSRRPDEKWGDRIVLLLEMDSLEEGQKAQIFDVLKASLPKYHQPKEVLTLNPFPSTESGKIDRGKLAILLSKQP